MVVQASWLSRVGFDVHARVGLDTGVCHAGGAQQNVFALGLMSMLLRGTMNGVCFMW